MTTGPLQRLAELVRRELDAKNARVEIGGDPPDDAAQLWCELKGGWRVVAVFDGVPEDREERLSRLKTLVDSFAGLLASSDQPAGRVPVSQALTAALIDLASRAGGFGAVVIDATSPVIWGASDASISEREDVDAALRLAAIDQRARDAGLDLATLLVLDNKALGRELGQQGVQQLLQAELLREVALRSGQFRDAASWRAHITMAHAMAAARKLVRESPHPANLREMSQDKDFGFVVKAFANIYLLVVAFNGPYSALHAEAAVLHALPHIEQLVLSLPPVPPPTREAKGARVVPLASRRKSRR